MTKLFKSKIFYYFFIIIVGLDVLYMVKEPILYGVNIFPPEKYLTFGFALVVGLVLLLLYNKYKIENQ